MAFLIPAMIALDDSMNVVNENGLPCPQVLVIADTKALILQIDKISNLICKGYKNLKIAHIFG